VVAVAFKVQHGIDHVFHDLWAGNISIFSYVTHQNYRGVGSLGKLNQFGGTLFNLRYTSRTTFYVFGLQGLNGIDDDHIGDNLPNLMKYFLGLRFTQHKAMVVFGRNTVSSKFDLTLTFFSRHIQDLVLQL